MRPDFETEKKRLDNQILEHLLKQYPTRELMNDYVGIDYRIIKSFGILLFAAIILLQGDARFGINSDINDMIISVLK